MDSALLERMSKIMAYTRNNAGTKPSKKPKKKDKLAALHGMGSAGGTNFPIVHGTDNIMPKPAGNVLSLLPIANVIFDWRILAEMLLGC